MTLQDLNCFLLGTSNIGLPPAAGATAVAVLDEQVAAADFAFALARGLGAGSGGVVLRHVDFKLLGIGIGRRFPAGFFCVGVEVVGKVLGVRMTNFPSVGETSVSLQFRLAPFEIEGLDNSAPF